MIIEVPKNAIGERLDRFLVNELDLSRSQISQRIEHGDVLVNGVPPSKAGLKLQGTETIEVTIPPPPSSTAIPQDIPISIVYEDDQLVVVNKAAGMVVHPSPGHDSGTLVNALLHRFNTLADSALTEDGRPRPGIVHRLDKDTSGLIVVARTALAKDSLSQQLAEYTLTRKYLALVHGRSLAEKGTWTTLHGRHPKHRKRFSSNVSSGRTATTHWKVLLRAQQACLIQCQLQTGRTHQIRMHCSDHRFPVCGDLLYGGVRKGMGSEGAAIRKLTRQALHAWQMEFTHPETQQRVMLSADPPEDMSNVLNRLFGDWKRMISEPQRMQLDE